MPVIDFYVLQNTAPLYCTEGRVKILKIIVCRREDKD